jgi:hypothetical protein
MTAPSGSRGTRSEGVVQVLILLAIGSCAAAASLTLRTRAFIRGGAEGTRTPDPHTARLRPSGVTAWSCWSGWPGWSSDVRRGPARWLLGWLLAAVGERFLARGVRALDDARRGPRGQRLHPRCF